jgi:hypothetical protein
MLAILVCVYDIYIYIYILICRVLEVTPMALLVQAKLSLLKHLGKHLDVRSVMHTQILKYVLIRT